MKVKEYIDERIESINNYLHSDEVDPETIFDNNSVLEVLYSSRNKDIEEIKKDLENLEQRYEVISYKEGYENDCDKLIQQIGALKSVISWCKN